MRIMGNHRALLKIRPTIAEVRGRAAFEKPHLALLCRGPMQLYFAYGSNMQRAAMARRCPGARALGPAALEGYRLLRRARRLGFGHARRAALRVHGVLWRLTPRDIAALHAYEHCCTGDSTMCGTLPVRVGSRGACRP